MKKLQIGGDQVLEAVRIEKTETEITGYDEKGREVFSFKGINNWSAFTLLDGAIWDEVRLTVEQEMQQLKARQDESENAILSLMDMSLMGGM